MTLKWVSLKAGEENDQNSFIQTFSESVMKSNSSSEQIYSKFIHSNINTDRDFVFHFKMNR